MDVTIRDESPTGRVTHELVVHGLSERCTVRDLIRTRVREEVARHHANQVARHHANQVARHNANQVARHQANQVARQQAGTFQGLVQPTDTEAVLNGYRLRRPRQLDWERQADVAEEAFGRNGFFVLVDDHQPESLDEELTITADTDIAFVRLTPLVGG